MVISFIMSVASLMMKHTHTHDIVPIRDSVETIMEFKPDEIVTLLKGLSNPERIKILKILTTNPDGKYAQELLAETHLSEGSLHYHIRWLLKSQMIAQELTRGKYITTRLGVVAVSLIGILVHSIKV
jgi:DNA-binding transcriptional ArsR family regulator